MSVHRAGDAAAAVLKGIKVADFSWSVAGPLMVRYLADHGAEVVRIESGTRPDVVRTGAPYKDNVPGLNRSVFFANLNCNKYSLSLDLRHPGSQSVVRKILAWADIMVESFTPGTLKKWDLTYDQVKEIRPDIIMISASVQGQDGPYAGHSAFGFHLMGLAGLVEVTGWPDRGPVQPAGAYTDVIAPPFGAAAVLAALIHRRRTGKGQYIDLSQYETSAHFVAPLLMDYSANHRLATRSGNRCSHAAPHGAYPCLGDDRWCAIGVFNDAEWEGFCKAVGSPGWTGDPRFATFPGRKKNEDALDALVARATSSFTAEEIVSRLQANGVHAGIVQNAEDVQNDFQLAHRQHFWSFTHPEIGEHTCDRLPFRLSRTPSQAVRAAPCLGQDTDFVCTQLLGIPDDEFVALLEAGVFE